MTIPPRLPSTLLVILALAQPASRGLVATEDGGSACETSCCCDEPAPDAPEATRSTCPCCESSPAPATAPSASAGCRPELVVDGTMLGPTPPLDASRGDSAVPPAAVLPRRPALLLFCVRIV